MPLQASAQTTLRLILDARIEIAAAPFLLALDRGYFKAEGIDLTIEAGASAGEVITRVGTNTFDLGVTDMNLLIRARDQNNAPQPRAIFMLHNRGAFAVVGRKSRGISRIEDLEGKKLGAPANDSSAAQWPVLLKITGLDGSKIKLENVGFAVREPMLAAGEVDAITGFTYTAPINLRERGVPAEDIVVFPMAEYGLNLYGNVVVASPKLAVERPEVVRAFVRALIKGLRDMIQEPAAGVEAVMARNNLLRREVELERLRILIKDHIVTQETLDLGLGAADMTRLDSTIDKLNAAFNLRNAPKAADVFDASFLPERSERRAD